MEAAMKKTIKNPTELLIEQLLTEKQMKYKGGIYYITQTELAYNSNRIEGSQLSKEHTRSLFETQTILAQKDELIRSDDIIETTNHFRAFDYILEEAYHPLTENGIKKIHEILKSNTSDAMVSWFNVGEYKALNNVIGERETAAPEEVQPKIAALLNSYELKKSKDIDDIIAFHVKFERIHPFQDGNGRVGRLILFKECLRQGIIPFIIDAKHKTFYYRGLQEYNHEKGYLRDTCLSAQDWYTEYCKKYVHNFLQSYQSNDTGHSR